MNGRRTASPTFVGIVGLAVACSAAEDGSQAKPSVGPTIVDVAPPTAPAATATDLAGAAIDPFADATTEVVVLAFVTPDCPVSNRYAPELARIAAAQSPARVSWWLVYPDPDVDAAQIEQHRREYGLPGTPVRDPAHVLVARARVEVTPEVAVFHRDGATMSLAYHGRIDDRVPEFGRARPQPTRRELVDALDAVLRRAPVASPTAAAVGCPIDDLR